MCRPQTCYFDSTVSVWRSDRNGGGYELAHLYTGFQSGPGQVLFDANCDLCPEPECRDRALHYVPSSQAVSVASLAQHTRVISGLAVDRGPYPTEDGGEADWAVELVNSLVEPIAPDSPAPELVVFRDFSGKTIDLLNGETVPYKIALLSTDLVDEFMGAVRIRDGGTLPVLVAAPQSPSPWGRVSIVRHIENHSPAEDIEILLAHELEMTTDRFTVGWQSLEVSHEAFGDAPASLRIEVGDGETGERDELIVPLLL